MSLANALYMHMLNAIYSSGVSISKKVQLNYRKILRKTKRIDRVPSVLGKIKESGFLHLQREMAMKENIIETYKIMNIQRRQMDVIYFAVSYDE